MITLNDKDHLDGIFYDIYDIDSVGVRPQQCLVEALIGGDVFAYGPGNIRFTVSNDLPSDTISNLFATPIIARIFDPTLYGEPYPAHIVPPEYLNGDCDRLRALRKDLEVQKRAGRSFTLRSLAGLEAALDQTELTEIEAEKVASALSAKYGITSSAKKCIDFLGGTYDAIDKETLGWRNDYLSESDRQTHVFWDAVYKFWSTAGRGERTLYHAAKLNLMNEITGAAIRKSRSLGLDPDQFTRNDPGHAAYWQKTFGEGVPTPDVLLAGSRCTVDLARKKYAVQGTWDQRL